MELLLWHTGSVALWERWEMGLIPSPAQWVKDPALPQLRLRLRLQLGSDPWPRSSKCHRSPPPQKKRTLLNRKNQIEIEAKKLKNR